MYEIFVGNGHKGNSARTVDIHTTWSISENGYAYWLYNSQIRVSLYIIKGTDESFALDRFLALDRLFRDGNTTIIDNFISSVMVKYMDLSIFSGIIADISKQQYMNGSNAKLKEIKECLELDID